jgi:hypothetical protein
MARTVEGFSLEAATRRNYEMLTVKHIRFDGAEEIGTTSRVLFYPSDTMRMFPDAPNPHLQGMVTLVSPNGTTDIHGGIVYVMNESGKTVSKYDLGEDDGRRGAAA